MAMDRIGFLLKHAYLAYDALAASHYEAIGATARECGVLSQIRDAEGLSQLELATALGVDRTTMAQLLDGLEQRGLVTRTPMSTDRRKNLVSLTPAACDLLARDQTVRKELDREFLSPIGDYEQVAFRSALQTIVQHHRDSFHAT